MSRHLRVKVTHTEAERPTLVPQQLFRRINPRPTETHSRPLGSGSGIFLEAHLKGLVSLIFFKDIAIALGLLVGSNLP